MLKSTKLLFLLPALACALLLTTGCNKLLSMLRFNVNDSQSFTVPAIFPYAATGPSLLPPVTVNSTATQTYSNNNTSADYVQDVMLEKMTLTATSPAGQTFDLVKSVKLYISSDATGTNKTLMASLDNVPTGRTSIELVPTPHTKLDLYLRKNSYALTSEIELTQAPAKDVVVRVDSKFSVAANLP